MKILIALLIGMIVILFGFTEAKTDLNTILTSGSEAAIDTTFDVDAAISEINSFIGDRKDLPAEEVFENIQIMKGFPAGRVPLIMKMAFNNSLGVDCTHCHEPANWADDSKTPKKVTREMWKMVGTINLELLGKIDGLQSDSPVVNCTTCHRGQTKPALNMQ